MEPATHTATGTTTYLGPLDLYTPLSIFVSSLFVGTTAGGVFGFFGTLWSIYSIVAYVASFIFLYIFIYSSTGFSRLVAAQRAELETQHEAWLIAHGAKRPTTGRWEEIQSHLASESPRDWKMAIIEADIMLDQALKEAGYGGTSLGERLRSVSPQALGSLDDAWQAHKVRNQIAHGGADFVLTQRLAGETIARYRNVLQELRAI